MPMTQNFVQYFLDCIAKITETHNTTSLVEFLVECRDVKQLLNEVE